MNGKAQFLMHFKPSHRYLREIIAVYPFALIRILEIVKSKANFLIKWYLESYFIYKTCTV